METKENKVLFQMLHRGGNLVTKRLVHELLYFLWYLLISHSMTFEDNYLQQVL